MQSRARSGINWLVLFLGIGAQSADTYAAFVCYDERHFPAVFKLEETKDGIQALLGGVYTDLKRKVFPVVAYREGSGWTYVEARKCEQCEFNHHGGKCQEPIPKWESISRKDRTCMPGEDCRNGIPVIRPGAEDQEKSIEETPSSCAVGDDAVWFGINFYRGEGLTGYGGLGRFERRTNSLNIRRPPELKEHPIHKVVWDGEHLWAATTTNYECLGHPPALGLIKYMWDTKTLTLFKGKDDGPCGFVIHDLLWTKDVLWVATDVGLSRWGAKSGQWTHYLPDMKSPEKVKEARCEVFYRGLLDILPKNESWFDESRSYHQVFYENLENFRPHFIKRYEGK